MSNVYTIFNDSRDLSFEKNSNSGSLRSPEAVILKEDNDSSVNQDKYALTPEEQCNSITENLINLAPDQKQGDNIPMHDSDIRRLEDRIEASNREFQLKLDASNAAANARLE